jgi:predicted lysophospholipase L1 biosynthesis ABC-type transport system permease subunit
VNRAFVRRFLDGADPLGHRLRIGRAESSEWRTIVGVVPDLWAAGLDAPPPDRNPPAVYVPLVQAAPAGASIAVRVAGQTESFTPALRAAASAVDPDVPLYAVGTMESVIADNNWFYGMAALIFALCGGAALVLTAAGLYGVIAYSVSQRTREFGIRMAMGAEPEDIQRMVVRNGSGQLILGIAAGLILAFGGTRGVASLLFDVRPSDPLVLGATTALLLVIALAAMLVPARRAARADPLQALRGH